VTDHSHSSAHSEDAAHVLPASVLLGTAAALLTLTVITVAVSRIDLGAFNVVVALAVACFKATLVAMFFMHLKYEGRFKAVIFVTALFFAVLFVGFVVFDTMQYQPDLRAAAAAAAQKAP
jgi:cytochrome c oxidase subunit 4